MARTEPRDSLEGSRHDRGRVRRPGAERL